MKSEEALNQILGGVENCGDPVVECPLQDAHKAYHPVQEALALIAALSTPRQPNHRLETTP